MTDPNFSFDLTGETPDLGGSAPPQGCYRMKIVSIEGTNNNDGSPAYKVGFTVIEGEAQGQGLTVRFNMPTGDASKDSFKRKMLALLFRGCRIGENHLAGLNYAKVAQIMQAIQGKTLVVFVEDQGTRIDDKGQERRNYEGYPVQVDKEAEALAGTWNPRSGSRPQAPAAGYSPTQAPQTQAQPQVVQPNGGGNPVQPQVVAQQQAQPQGDQFGGLFNQMP